ALVRGRPRSWTGRIEAPIGRDRREPTRHSLDTDTPREAITHFDVERLLDRHALLDVRLETGPTHQSRVHLAAIGLPVVGDPVYGVPDERLRRQFLHAWRLAFPHPIGGERVEGESPLPDARPSALARLASERRRSASRKSASASAASTGKCAVPALKEHATGSSSFANSSPTRSFRRSINSDPASSSASTRYAANSSPPIRPARSEPRRDSRRSLPSRCKTWSPAGWPSVSLIALKHSRSRKTRERPWP